MKIWLTVKLGGAEEAPSTFLVRNFPDVEVSPAPGDRVELYEDGFCQDVYNRFFGHDGEYHTNLKDLCIDPHRMDAESEPWRSRNVAWWSAMRCAGYPELMEWLKGTGWQVVSDEEDG